MKAYLYSIAQASFIIIFVFTSLFAFSQVKNFWKGGTPGMEQDWNCPKNWSNYKVPDEFSDVTIPDVSSTSLSSPEIRKGNVEVNALFMESGSHLTIGKDAQLVVIQSATGFFQSNIKVDGLLYLLDEISPASANATALVVPKRQ